MVSSREQQSRAVVSSWGTVVGRNKSQDLHHHHHSRSDIAVGAQHVTRSRLFIRKHRLGRHRRSHITCITPDTLCHLCTFPFPFLYFFGLGVGVALEFAVVLGVEVLGVGAALLGGALGACGVFCVLLDVWGVASVSRNTGDFCSDRQTGVADVRASVVAAGVGLFSPDVTLSSRQQESAKKSLTTRHV